MAISYKDSGVDIHSGYKAVELMKKYAKSTYNQNVLGGLGSFGALYSLAGEDLANPVLVSGTDGVGTKLKYAFALNKHDTIGIDCVAMCANDVACQGAKPLFFLDYIAIGKLIPEVAAEIVKGVAEGCNQAGCALVGGETAEMPGFYTEGEYDIAGFCVGIVNKDKMLDGSKVKAGDVLIGLASSGPHSNGYSLIRKLFGTDPAQLNKYYDELGKTLGEALLMPTRIYVKSLRAAAKKIDIKGLSHITGGGFIENIPRMMSKELGAKINLSAYKLPSIFEMIKERSGLFNDQLYNTFNMGIGMVVAVDKEQVKTALEAFTEAGETACVLGEVDDSGEITLC